MHERVPNTVVGRYEELIEKRGSTGLTRDEADELGRLMAEREGKADQYGTADNPPPDVEVERVGKEEATEEDIQQVEELKEAEKAQQAEKAEAAAPKGSEQRPEEERRVEPPKPGSQGPPPA